jgi:hypothetical protein
MAASRVIAYALVLRIRSFFHFTHPHKTGGGSIYEKRLAYVSVFYIVSVINH